MARSKLPPEIQQQVRQRANCICEYCHASEQWQYVQFTIDHIVPLKRGGQETLDNLALACFHCNRYKSSLNSALDPQTDERVSLFNPRTQNWQEHFIWSADCLKIVGLTALGRATVEALRLNRERILAIRAADKTVGRHPPLEDPVQNQ
jgi:5-methylcytosine-specific restriction endonuclease McrA